MNNTESSFAAKLAADFPSLFHCDEKSGQRFDPPNGLWVPKGWEHLVYSLCAELDALAKEKQLTITLLGAKSKLGGLRFYTSCTEPCEIIGYLVQFAENLSHKICEETGNAGSICVRDGVFRTLGPEIADQSGFRPLTPFFSV